MSVNRFQMIVLAVASSVSVSAWAGEAVVVPGSLDVAHTVSEMLKVDADRAILAEQRMLAEAQSRVGGSPVQGSTNYASMPGSPSPELAAPVPVPVMMEVLGIFGLGENLLADVAIDKTRVRFKRGHPMPLGASSDFQYRLVEIKVPCVKIADANKVEHNICLTKSAL